MGPNEVVTYLAAMGAPISLTTLRRYVREGVVTPPDVRSLGRGRGKESEYSPLAVQEAYVAAKLVGRPLYPTPLPPITIEGVGTFTIPRRPLSVDDVRVARDLAYKARLSEVNLPPVTPETSQEQFFLVLVAKEWIRLWMEAHRAFEAVARLEFEELRQRREALRRRAVEDIQKLARRPE